MSPTPLHEGSAQGEQSSQRESTFHQLGIAPQILRSLDHFGYKTPTPIQREAIPVAATGTDLIGIAQTGTGKTFAFGIPMVQSLMLQGGHALILVPTRELAFQVAESIAKIARPLNLKHVVLVGGELMYRQLRILKNGTPDIYIATPGRLNDILRRKKINLSQVRVVVLDEADRMLDMGFAPQIETIMDAVPTTRQTMLFSATMPAAITKLTEKYLKEPNRIEVAPAGSTVETVSQELVVVPRSLRDELLSKVLREYDKGPVLVFARTKEGANQLGATIRSFGHTATELHSERSLPERRQALLEFKHGRARVLVATDIAARGIDVSNIALVLNYDLPENPEDYVHRIGRTGRAGKGGHAISFATPEQGKEVKAIERLIRKPIPRSDRTDYALEDVFRSGGRRGPQRDRSQRGDRSRRPDTREFSEVSGPVGFTGPRSNRKRF